MNKAIRRSLIAFVAFVSMLTVYAVSPVEATPSAPTVEAAVSVAGFTYGAPSGSWCRSAHSSSGDWATLRCTYNPYGGWEHRTSVRCERWVNGRKVTTTYRGNWARHGFTSRAECGRGDFKSQSNQWRRLVQWQ